MDNFFVDDITSKKSSPKIDDLSSLKNASLDFLSNERNERTEKFDAEKPKEAVDDFLNFHDNVEETNPQPQNPVPIPSIEQKDDDEDEEIEDESKNEAEIDFHAIEDDYLNPYASSNLAKGVSEPQNEKFISSEDLLTDFKDPHPAPPAEVEQVEPEKVVEPVKIVEAPKPIVPVVAEKQPPVSALAPVEPVKPVVVEEQPKPQNAPPPVPVKRQSAGDTQIEAEKIFTSIGLG